MKDYDSPRNTATYAGFSVAFLRKRRALRLAPNYIKVGKKILYRKSDIDRFLAEHTIKTPEAIRA